MVRIGLVGKMVLALILAPAALALLPVRASAQIAGTIETKSYPSTQDGRRIGCVIEFRAAVQDFAYRSGAAVIVSGSMGFMNYPGKQPAVTLKVVLNDVSANGETVSKDTAPPASISLVDVDGDSNAPAQLTSALGEQPGSRIAAFSLDGYAGIFDRILSQKELALLFNRRPGGTDVRVLVDLTIENLDDSGKPIRGDQTVKGFFACSGKLLADLKGAGN